MFPTSLHDWNSEGFMPFSWMTPLFSSSGNQKLKENKVQRRGLTIMKI